MCRSFLGTDLILAGKKRKLQGTCEKTESSTTLAVGALDDFAPDGEDDACQIHIGERLGKLEQLFDKFVCRKSSKLTLDIASSQDSSQTAVSRQSDEKPFKFTGLPHLPKSNGQSLADGIVSIQYWCNYLYRTDWLSARNTYLVVGSEY